MKIDLTQTIKNFEGETLTQNGEPLTIGKMLRQVLGQPSDKDNGDKRITKYNLGIKCVADEVELSVDERKLIKDLLDEFKVSPIIYGRISEAFEENSKLEKVSKNGEKELAEQKAN